MLHQPSKIGSTILGINRTISIFSGSIQKMTSPGLVLEYALPNNCRRLEPIPDSRCDMIFIPRPRNISRTSEQDPSIMTIRYPLSLIRLIDSIANLNRVSSTDSYKVVVATIICCLFTVSSLSLFVIGSGLI